MIKLSSEKNGFFTSHKIKITFIGDIIKSVYWLDSTCSQILGPFALLLHYSPSQSETHLLSLTRKHSRRMRTGRLPIVHTSVATRCQHQRKWGPQVNKFEQVSSLGQQMSLAGFLCSQVPCPEEGAFVEKITLNQLGIIGKYMLAVEKSALFSYAMLRLQ